MQHIDLQHRRHAQRHLTARHLIAVVLVAALLASVISVQQATVARSQSQQLSVVAAEAAEAERALQTFRRANPDVADNRELMEEVERLQDERGVRRQLLNNLERSAGLRNVSYYGFMEALAVHRIDGVWLTGFGLDNRPGSERLRVSLNGQAEAAELLPVYLDRLRDSRLGSAGLTGLTFNNLELQRLTDTDNGIARYRFQMRTETSGNDTPSNPGRRSTP